MRRGIAVTWHLASFLIAALLYFFFVLPRWPELMGDTSHTLGTAMRIVCGAVFGLSALPVVFTLIQARKPEFGTPQLALSLRVWSIIGQITAGVLIIGTAIAEIWLPLDDAGRWLFAVYGAAAATAVLGAVAFYLAFAAELPPPPPKPLKPKKDKVNRRQKAADDEAPAGELVNDAEAGVSESDEVVASEETVEPEETVDPEETPADPAEVKATDGTEASTESESEDASEADEAPVSEDETGRRGLLNRRRTAAKR